MNIMEIYFYLLNKDDYILIVFLVIISLFIFMVIHSSFIIKKNLFNQKKLDDFDITIIVVLLSLEIFVLFSMIYATSPYKIADKNEIDEALQKVKIYKNDHELSLCSKNIIVYNDNFLDKSLKKYNSCIKKVLNQRIHKEKKKEFLDIVRN